MCGIIGIVTKDTSAVKYKEVANKMADSISYRGPDASGFAYFPTCILGHRRLSIIDLSSGGQPMYGNDSGVALTFNGEIYGYQEIKTGLKDYKFKTSSDTEVILALYNTYGNNFLEKLPGMFSFAIWDESKRTLIAARDRFGEKPFYYAYGKNGEFIFASEIKAILASGLIEPIISKESIAHYLHKLYVHPSKTIYENVYVLPPAHKLELTNGKLTINRYWNIPITNKKITMDEALPKFKKLLREAVKKQLVADVPVGAFLSGGLDSTTVVSIASEISPKIKTFSFGYEGTKNELSFAKMAAEKYKTDHYELHDKDNDIAELLLKMADIYDEPLADSSCISTYLISKLTREHTTVVLSGDGGDELLGGYVGWYRSIINMTDKELKSFPGKSLFMRLVAQIALRTSYKDKAGLISKARGLYYRDKFKNAFDAHTASNVFFKKSQIRDLGLNVEIQKSKPSWTIDNTADDAMKNDIEDYMPGDILVKIDRASMANSLELRAPFLDVPFAEFALSLPYNLKIDKKEEKLILRKAFSEKWPEPIKNRSKLGFGAPINIWQEKPKVKELIETYLNDKNKKIYKFISYNKTKKYLKKADDKRWILLVLSIWLEKHNFIIK